MENIKNSFNMSKSYIENSLLWLAMLIDLITDYSPNKQQTNTLAYNVILNIYKELEWL